jgi:hypothetical protein
MRMICAALACLASPAFAEETVSFQSPSGNIQCVISTGDFGDVRCDILQFTPSRLPAPEDCAFQWGRSFGVNAAAAQGYLMCVSDDLSGATPYTLGYGEVVERGGYRCSSEKTGMTCTNQTGHGFSLSRAKQSLF